MEEHLQMWLQDLKVTPLIKLVTSDKSLKK